MLRKRITAGILLVLGIFVGLYVYRSEITKQNPFRLGLDLSGGSYLVYKADTTEIAPEEVGESMDSLRDVIERRINAFGVAEPNVQTESHTFGVDVPEERLIIELPGVTNLDQAIEMIGQTPLLEFKTETTPEEVARIDAELAELIASSVDAVDPQVLEGEQTATSPTTDVAAKIAELQNQRYVTTALTGKYLEKARMEFSQSGVQGGGSLQAQPIIGLSFNAEGAKLFEEITKANVGKTLAIYLDGQLIQAPMVNTAITGGQAIIEGNFTIEEAKTTVGRLNSGALPIPIELISTNTVGPTLGQGAIDAGIQAGVIGLVLVGLMLLLWYRLPGLIAVVALGIYTSLVLWLFKFIPVTLTSAGITGFIISIGLAVDANILIFERMKEELKQGAMIYDAIEIGFKRAWASIRDSNISSLISTIILFWIGTPLIKGFALTFGIGILVSMLTAVTFTRIMLFALNKKESDSKLEKFLYGSGFSRTSDKQK
jgi:preprotein translocase subunit SecD